MAAPVLTISFSTSCSRVDVDFCFFFERHSAAISPINSKPPLGVIPRAVVRGGAGQEIEGRKRPHRATVALVLLSKDELAFFESYAT